MSTSLTRRRFHRMAAGVFTAASYARILGANDRVRMGYIGVGNRGDQVHQAFLEHGDQQTVALCDLREDYMDFAVGKSRATPKKYKEYRHLLDDKDVDAVVIATPDHWHAIMFIEACRAGKDVYVEKPLSLTVKEGRRMVEVGAETRRVVQVGLHRRSSPTLREAAEFVRSGGIGKVTAANSWHLRNDWPVGIGNFGPQNPPSEEEWEKWLGPAPKVPYTPNRTYYNFRWFLDYSGGQLTNFGVHYVDLMRWCLGQDSPRAVMAMGGKFAVEDDRDIPDTMQVTWQWEGSTPALMSYSQYNANGAAANPQRSEIELRGTLGTIYFNNQSWVVVPESTHDQPAPARTPLDRVTERQWAAGRKTQIQPRQGKEGEATIRHARNFLDCVKSRAKPNCDILTGHLSNIPPLIGNIAWKSRAFLEWDARAEQFPNHPAANRRLHYEYRKPYKLG
jgi:predicted dehydrogenase